MSNYGAVVIVIATAACRCWVALPVNGTGGALWARASNNVKKPQSQICASCKKLDLRFFENKTESFLVSVTHFILRFAIVQNRFDQTNKIKINNINDNHIKSEVSLHFGGSGLLGGIG